MRRAAIIAGLLVAACAADTAPPNKPTAPLALPRYHIRNIPEGQTTDQVHQHVAEVAQPYSFGARPVVLPALRSIAHLDQDPGDSLEVEWYRVGLRSYCFTLDYDRHLLEPIVYRGGRVLGAGWPFLASNYRALKVTERTYRLWLVVGFGICDR